MKFSYDYSEFIQEMNEELIDRILTMDDFIWIVRKDTVAYDNYKPACDWYYLQDLKNAENEEDKFKAVKIKVSNFIEEITFHNRII